MEHESEYESRKVDERRSLIMMRERLTLERQSDNLQEHSHLIGVQIKLIFASGRSLESVAKVFGLFETLSVLKKCQGSVERLINSISLLQKEAGVRVLDPQQSTLAEHMIESEQ